MVNFFKKDIIPMLNEQLKNILIVNLGGIGDVLLSLPALKALRSSLPAAKISLLTVPRSAEVVRDFQFLDNIILFRRGLKNKFGLISTLRGIRPDLVINMRPLTSFISAIKMAFLFMLIRAEYRMGRDTEKRGFFFNIKIPEDDVAKIHDLDYYLDMFKVLGVKSNDYNINLSVRKSDIDYIDSLLLEHGIAKDDVVIGINPGASWPTRRWPLENFSSLSELILKERKCKIVITGSQSETSLANKLQTICKADLVNLAGETTFGQLMALIKRCSLFISNDTGPMHLAAALHTPLIAIFWSGDFVRYDPRRLSDKLAIVMYNKTSCVPCFKARYVSMDSLGLIKPEDVLAAALKLI